MQDTPNPCTCTSDPTITCRLHPEPSEMVNHPAHYNKHPSGVECIDVIEHMSFNIGNAIKYAWRADHKANREQDLRKAIWYLERELGMHKQNKVTKT